MSTSITDDKPTWKPPDNFSLTNWIEYMVVNTLGVGIPRNQLDMSKEFTGENKLLRDIVVAMFNIHTTDYVPYVVTEIEKTEEHHKGSYGIIETDLITWDTPVASKHLYIMIKKGLDVEPHELYLLYFMNHPGYAGAVFPHQMPSRGRVFR